MVLGIVLGVVILALIILYFTDEDRDGFPIFILSIFALIVVSVTIGSGLSKQFEIKQQVKPTVKIVTENGKSDTTYIYKFEEVK